jgi:hypothetical protein
MPGSLQNGKPNTQSRLPYLRYVAQEQQGVRWRKMPTLTAMTSKNVLSNLRSLCRCGDCSTPCLLDDHREHAWYVNLGTYTRYRDIAGRSGSTRRNVICFPTDTLVVVHLGDAAPKVDDAMISTPCFLRQETHPQGPARTMQGELTVC